ncbi:ethylene-responsive transcription factor RAP2-2-like [Lycium barbarum]|uniref:ethylene-responsive transcription factor RAP2-2-like n=1 Tax=Lycium barbarum TaxID=112863 RepID=UPI00293E2687|nr:ethylene-responsive transcription factor RAP2-2-like [Lycium barbarum]
MCGGTIISNYIVSNRTSLAAELLWGRADLSKKQKNPGNYHSKHLRSEVVALDDDFEADFKDFKEFDNDEDVEVDVEPFAFSTFKHSTGSKRKKRYEERSHKEEKI